MDDVDELVSSVSTSTSSTSTSSTSWNAAAKFDRSPGDWEFVDHKYGAWYRILTRDNKKYSDEKSPAGKTDYHTMGACYEVLEMLR